jgi:hypothetical protein
VARRFPEMTVVTLNRRPPNRPDRSSLRVAPPTPNYGPQSKGASPLSSGIPSHVHIGRARFVPALFLFTQTRVWAESSRGKGRSKRSLPP